MTQSPLSDSMFAMNEQELALVLFALRYLQANWDDARPIMGESEHFVGLQQPQQRQIDRLCQRLNTKAIDITPENLDLALNLAHTVCIEAPTDRRITSILDRFNISPDDANTLQIAIEMALKLDDEKGGDNGRRV